MLINCLIVYDYLTILSFCERALPVCLFENTTTAAIFLSFILEIGLEVGCVDLCVHVHFNVYVCVCPFVLTLNYVRMSKLSSTNYSTTCSNARCACPFPNGDVHSNVLLFSFSKCTQNLYIQHG